MVENRVAYDDLTDLLRSWNPSQHARNLVLVAFPIEHAHLRPRQLAQDISGIFVDFDCEFLQELEQDDWNDHLRFERRGNYGMGRMVADDWLGKLVERLSSERPLVIGNINLAVSYEIDVAAALYDATEQGLCIIAAGGKIQGRTLLIHNALPQTGAGAPAYEVVEHTQTPEPDPLPPQQDRLF